MTIGGGRYQLFDPIASGGMASVHYGRVIGASGFARTVAIKRLHAHIARDPEFVTMFIDEGRLAARIHHPNVVSVLDVVAEEDELFLVMEYIAGESLAELLRRAGQLPPAIAASVITQTLHGLHAAHEATSESGAPLAIVHRDVSPQNIVVGADGVARVLDFGVAKANARIAETREGEVKGKLSYMAPEQLRRVDVDRRADIYATGCVAWEALTGRRLFREENPGAVLTAIMCADIERVSRYADVSPEVDAIIAKSLAREPADRYATAIEMAQALERALPPATQGEVKNWVGETAREVIERRAARIAEIEREAKAPADARQLRARAETLRFDDDEPRDDTGSLLADIAAPSASPRTASSPPSARPEPAPARGGRSLLVGVLVVAGLLFAVAVFVTVQPPKKVAAMPALIPSAVARPAPEPSLGPSPPPLAPPLPSAAPLATHAPVPRPAGPCNPPFEYVGNVKRWKTQCLWNRPSSPLSSS